MAAATDDKHGKTFRRKPSVTRWTATLFIITFAVWCVVLSILVARGHLLNTKSFESGTIFEDRTWLTRQAFLVYLWTGISLLTCILLLANIWIKRHWILTLCAICIMFVVMVATLARIWDKENQEIEAFKNRYLILNNLIYRPGDTEMHFINQGHYNVYRWQAEFKCCGLTDHHDWQPAIPPTCLCEGEDDSSGCVAIGNSLVYKKPCFPTVLSLVEKRSSRFWIVTLVWITIAGAAFAIPALFLTVLIVLII